MNMNLLLFVALRKFGSMIGCPEGSHLQSANRAFNINNNNKYINYSAHSHLLETYDRF